VTPDNDDTTTPDSGSRRKPDIITRIKSFIREILDRFIPRSHV
jgi:hypothetical protein